MAILTDNQKRKALSSLHRAYCSSGLSIPWTKSEGFAELITIDAWQDANQASIAQQFSIPFRQMASAADLSLIFILISIARRLVSSPVHLDVLRKIIDEIQGIDGV